MLLGQVFLLTSDHAHPAGPTHDIRWVFGRDESPEADRMLEIPSTPSEAAATACNSRHGPKDGIVAVKVRQSSMLLGFWSSIHDYIPAL